MSIGGSWRQGELQRNEDQIGANCLNWRAIGDVRFDGVHACPSFEIDGIVSPNQSVFRHLA